MTQPRAEARGAVSVFRAREKRRIATREDINRQLAAIELHRDYLAKREAARVLSEQQAPLSAASESSEADQAVLSEAIADAELADQRLRASWERRYAVRSLVPLTPEQLAGSTIAALGLRQLFQTEAENEWQKNFDDKKKDGENDQEKKTAEIDETKKREEITELTKKRIDKVVSTYVSMFAAPSGAPQDVFSATADQALFFANDVRFLNWLAPSNGTLLERLQSIEDASQVAEELHLAILSRPATDDEKTDISNYLETRQKDRNKALRELAWGLLSSLEFRFNH